MARQKSKTYPINSAAFDNRDMTTIWWLAGGGFLINSRGTVLLLDPVISTRPDNPDVCETGLPLFVDYPLSTDRVERADAILYTHSDDDHLGPISAKKLAARLHATTLATSPSYQKLAGLGVNPEEIRMCRPGDSLTIGEVEIEVIDADHPHQLIDGIFNENTDLKKLRPFRSGDCCGYIVRTRDGNFLFTGDTRLMEFHLHLEDIHVLALDVSVCPYHLSTYGAIILANALSDALLYPYHYGTFDEPLIPGYNGSPSDVLPRVKRNERARVYAPGQPLSLKDGKEVQA